MFISKITLEDFRTYHGRQEISFSKNPDKNIFIISGNNGFGKTTLLNALVWGLYGKLMVDVDDKYRTEIYEAGGYKKFASSNLNKRSAINGISQVGISITIIGISIPSLPCDEVVIRRFYSIDKGVDEVEILIDGHENELTREVGPDIFINDFILPKEIAKFFFFDAEKIVLLAEIRSVEDKRKLSKAYSEILGIKKYEDLKSNLEEIRIRLRKEGPSNKDSQRFNELQHEIDQAKSLIREFDEQILALQEEKQSKKEASEQYQIKLIREGNTLSIEELNRLKEKRSKLSLEADELKDRLKDMLELAPFAIASNLMEQTYQQLKAEEAIKRKGIDSKVMSSKLKLVKKDLIKEFEHLNLSAEKLKQLSLSFAASVNRHFRVDYAEENAKKVLIDLTKAEQNEFEAIYNNLKGSYSTAFKELTTIYKNNRNAVNKIVRQLNDAEGKENDLLIKEIRQQKSILDARIDEIDIKIVLTSQEIGGLQHTITSKAKVASELRKKLNVYEVDQAKDKAAARMVAELEEFLTRLKSQKKLSLEYRIKKELNGLMHKKNFISKVEVEIEGDLIDIHLLDKSGLIIGKETLSKGEQQLYATALLKSLVDESNISFPVFIDSPLQKFDKLHSGNIIKDFYPNISEQVVLFPLVEKEISEIEYHLLLPKVNQTYTIKQQEAYCSKIIEVAPLELFHPSNAKDEFIQEY